MGADILTPPRSTTPEPQQMVDSSDFEFENMERYLESGRFTDLKVICGGHTFRVHRLIVAANCTYFEETLQKSSKKNEISLADDQDPAVIARLLYFLYSGRYPTTHIAHLDVKSFSEVPDPYAAKDRLNLLHATMYSVGITFGVPDLATAASQAFRSLGHQDFCRDSDWPALAKYIYESTPIGSNDLRKIVVREVLYATHHDRARFKMRDLKNAIKKAPELAIDLATVTLTKHTFRCDDCGHDQYLLVLPCLHWDQHETTDSDCFKRSLEEQECSNCHDFDVFDGADELQGNHSYVSQESIHHTTGST